MEIVKTTKFNKDELTQLTVGQLFNALMHPKSDLRNRIVFNLKRVGTNIEQHVPVEVIEVSHYDDSTVAFSICESSEVPTPQP